MRGACIIFLRVAVTLVLLLLLLIGLCWASATIDRDDVHANGIESLRILSEEGDFYRPVRYVAMLQRDNFTDALMIESAMTQYPGASAFRSMLISPFYEIGNPESMSADRYTKALAADSGALEPTTSYGRYWHGYAVTLRPLLKYMNIRGIRALNYTLLVVFLCAAGYMIWRRLGYKYMWAFLVSVMAVGFPVVPMSMQYVTCFLICFLALSAVLWLPQRRIESPDAALLFVIVGGATSFFDFLTTPLITFGLPVTVLLLRRNRFPDWRMLLLCGGVWAAGYVGVWVAKWVLTGIFTPFDIFSDVADAAATRSSSVVLAEYGYRGYALIGALLAFVAIIIFMMCKAVKRCGVALVKLNASLIAISLTPVAWVILMQNHSFIHYWFVWRIFAVMFFAAGAFWIRCFSSESRKNLTL